ncbi:ankyrin repeat domain-containing protein [bacterium]|nr:ankyrin repeat domain-containing protein [bacterium]
MPQELAYAAEANNLQTVQVFLDKGADPSIEVDTGGTLVAHALRGGQSEMTKLLLQAGASPTPEGPPENPLTCLAVSGGHLDVLSQLLDQLEVKSVASLR